MPTTRPTALLFALAIGVAAVAIACASDSNTDGRAPSLTLEALTATSTDPVALTATSTSPPTPPVTPQFLALAAQIQQALIDENIGFFRERAATQAGQEGFSLGEFRAPDGPPPPAAKGGQVSLDEVASAISVLWEQTAAGATDAYGSADPVLYAIGTDKGVNAGRDFTTVLTAIVDRPADIPGEGPLRIAVVLTWVFAESEDFNFVFTLKAYHQAEEWLEHGPATHERMPIWQRYAP